MSDNKVIQFPRKKAIFSYEQREGVSDCLSKYTNDHEKAALDVEDELCRQLVVLVREGMTFLGNKIGMWVANKALKP